MVASVSDSFCCKYAVSVRTSNDWRPPNNETQAGLTLDPTFTIHRFRAGQESDNPIFLAGKERIFEGMRKAGVPEG